MSERRWHEVLGIAAGVRDPDLYQLLGLERRRFDPSLVERAYLERMQKVAAHQRPEHREHVERARVELARARKLLANAQERAAYDRELTDKRTARLRKLVDPILTKGALDLAAERTLVATGVQLGMTEDEAREAIRDELRRRRETQRHAAQAPQRPPTPGSPSGSAVRRTTPGANPEPSLGTSRAGRTPPRTPQPTRASGVTELDARGRDREPAGQGDTVAGPPAPKPKGGSLVGTTIDGKYEVVAKLGEGGMGSVFKARHVLLDKIVALKVVNPALVDRPAVRERFLREATAAMEFIHPNAVPVRELGSTKDGLLYMTQDFSPGRSLGAILEDEQKLDPRRALELVRQCLLALGEAHRKGIVHRDLKPDNVLVETDGAGERARVCDFGIAKITDDDTSVGLTGGAVIGTPQYMAPEQGAGDKVDLRADLYAMGCVLYELVTGSQVFQADKAVQVIMMHVTQPPEPPSQRAPGTPRELDEVVLKALAKAPKDRFQTAEEFVQAIDATVAKLPKAKQKPPRPKTRTVKIPKPDLTASDMGVKFCDRCGVSVPERWRETKEAKRVGTRLLCADCWMPVHAGKQCLGCLRPLAKDETSIPAGGRKRLCRSCGAKAEVMRVCAGCELILPAVAFERGQAVSLGGKFYCKDCAKKSRV